MIVHLNKYDSITTSCRIRYGIHGRHEILQKDWF